MDDTLWDVTMPPIPIKDLEFNISDFTILQVNENQEVSAVADPAYEQFLADVWVGIVLTLMVLSCVCFMCTCLIYHKFQEWKSRVIPARAASANVEAGTIESELPSYTIASGLPTYEEALEQLKKVKELQQQEKSGNGKTIAQETNESRRQQQEQSSEGPATTTTTLSVFNLFQIYNKGNGRRYSKST